MTSMTLAVVVSDVSYLVFQVTGSDCMANIKHSPVQMQRKV